MWLWVAGAMAQEIVVKQDAGQVIEPGGVTRLEFQSAREVPIHRILATSMGSGGGFGWSYSSYGETTERLCSTPCTLEVPDGTYRLRVGDNLVFGKRITVNARGEPLAWKVRSPRPVSGAAGILLTGVGLGGVTGGGMLAALGDPEGAPLALVSAPVATLGLYLLLDAFAHARPVTP